LQTDFYSRVRLAERPQRLFEYVHIVALSLILYHEHGLTHLLFSLSSGGGVTVPCPYGRTDHRRLPSWLLKLKDGCARWQGTGGGVLFFSKPAFRAARHIHKRLYARYAYVQRCGLLVDPLAFVPRAAGGQRSYLLLVASNFTLSLFLGGCAAGATGGGWGRAVFFSPNPTHSGVRLASSQRGWLNSVLCRGMVREKIFTPFLGQIHKAIITVSAQNCAQALVFSFVFSAQSMQPP
jgi:hypothetical protein